jgi:predicted nucleotidyltransferase
MLADKLETAKRWTEKVVEVLKDEVLEISLFGSVARSTDRKGSDIDLLIIVSEEREKALDIIFDKLGDAFLELAGKGVIAENIVENEEEWKKMEKKGFSTSSVENNSVILHVSSNSPQGDILDTTKALIANCQKKDLCL